MSGIGGSYFEAILGTAMTAALLGGQVTSGNIKITKKKHAYNTMGPTGVGTVAGGGLWEQSKPGVGAAEVDLAAIHDPSQSAVNQFLSILFSRRNQKGTLCMFIPAANIDPVVYPNNRGLEFWAGTANMFTGFTMDMDLNNIAPITSNIPFSGVGEHGTILCHNTAVTATGLIGGAGAYIYQKPDIPASVIQNAAGIIATDTALYPRQGEMAWFEPGQLLLIDTDQMTVTTIAGVSGGPAGTGQVNVNRALNNGATPAAHALNAPIYINAAGATGFSLWVALLDWIGPGGIHLAGTPAVQVALYQSGTSGGTYAAISPLATGGSATPVLASLGVQRVISGVLPTPGPATLPYLQPFLVALGTGITSVTLSIGVVLHDVTGRRN